MCAEGLGWNRHVRLLMRTLEGRESEIEGLSRKRDRIAGMLNEQGAAFGDDLAPRGAMRELERKAGVWWEHRWWVAEWPGEVVEHLMRLVVQ